MWLRNGEKMKIKLVIFALLLSAFATLLPLRQAQAVCTGCCNCATVRNAIISEINRHEDFLVNNFWKQHFKPALQTMANQINLGMVEQTKQLGTFMQGQSNLERQRILQEATAQTASDYLLSEQLCRYASLSQSLSASDDKARATRIGLMERSLNRQLGQTNTSASMGENSDMIERAKYRASRSCNPAANGGLDKTFCLNGGDSSSMNADIDFTRTFDSKPTLDIDFSTAKTAPTKDEQDILALSDNIFSSELFQRPSADDLKGTTKLNDARLAYMDMRSLVAKRSVAQNSFNALIAMKARGTGIDGNKAAGSTSFMAGVLKELGLDDTEALEYLGKAPSYDAQMEVLTKKVFQSPTFYVNLMDSPTNVDRQYAAMQSFGLMQQRDIFESILRSEMILSLLVELEVESYQDQVQGTMDKVRR